MTEESVTVRYSDEIGEIDESVNTDGDGGKYKKINESGQSSKKSNYVHQGTDGCLKEKTFDELLLEVAKCVSSLSIKVKEIKKPIP